MTYRQNLHVQQGATFSYVYTHRDSAGAAVNLTGYTARMSIRDCYGGALLAYLSTGADAAGGTITLGGSAGTVTIAMTATQTDALDPAYGAYADVMFAEWEAGLSGVYSPPAAQSARSFVYDLELVNGATVTRVLEGAVDMRRSVTA